MKRTKDKVVLLDLGGVVFQSSGQSNKEIDWTVINKLNHKHGRGLNIGEDLFPLFLKDYNEITSQNLDGNDFLKKLHDTLSMNRELVNYLSEHRDIIIVSDNYRENIDYLSQRYHFNTWAVAQYYSFDFEMMKTNPLFFEKLLDELKLPLDQLIFIDDSIKKLESAEKHGIQGFLFRSNADILNKIK